MTGPAAGAGGGAAGGPGYVPPTEETAAVALVAKRVYQPVFPGLPPRAQALIVNYLRPEALCAFAPVSKGAPHLVDLAKVSHQVEKVRAFLKYLPKAFEVLGRRPKVKTVEAYYKEVNAELTLILDGFPLEKVHALCQNIDQSDIPLELKILRDIHRDCTTKTLAQTKDPYLAQSLASHGLIRLALEIAQSTPDSYWQRFILLEVAKHPMIPDLIDYALEIAGSVGDEEHQADALGALATHPMTPEQAEKANELAKAMKRLNSRLRALVHIVINHCLSGRIDSALSMINDSPNDFDKSRILRDTILYLASNGQMDQALTITKSITKDSLKRVVLEKVMKDLASIGRDEEARTLTNSLTEDSDKSTVMAAFAVGLANSGRNDEALTILASINGEYIGLALVEITQKKMSPEQVDQTLSILQGMSTNLYRNTALLNLVKRPMTPEQIDKAQEIAESTKDEVAKYLILAATKRARLR